MIPTWSQIGRAALSVIVSPSRRLAAAASRWIERQEQREQRRLERTKFDIPEGFDDGGGYG